MRTANAVNVSIRALTCLAHLIFSARVCLLAYVHVRIHRHTWFLVHACVY